MRLRMKYQFDSLTLKMNGMWKNTIGYDPYAATDEGTQDCELARDQAKGLMALAKLSNQNTQTRGACKKCGMIGHLTYQCRNHLLDQPKAIPESSDDSLSDSEDSSSSSSSDEDARRFKRKRKSSSHHKKKSTKKEKNRISKELKGRKWVHRRHSSSDSDSTASHSHRKRHCGDSDRADTKNRSKKRKSLTSEKRNHRHRSKER
uniref:Uncharacterized protein AlNc14C7G947 n=1 Tax=Albugo laibachii Nc14 TaxID=890382 RepID=F0W1H9_9STRA|nr:conserved unknown protein putative [Albugo laibachii Nc14]|eukprot:CCA14908.1 conserved unknown protein putative [Albugo laibachii Nc14]